jgi:hypothetical protein
MVHVFITPPAPATVEERIIEDQVGTRCSVGFLPLGIRHLTWHLHHMPDVTPQKRMLGHVVGLATSSLMVGVFFMQGLYDGLRGNPLAFLYALLVVALSVVVFIHGRRIMREGVLPTSS